MQTHYDRLGVPRDVDQEALRRAWKRVVRTVHPDVGGDTEQFQQLQAAYAVLSDAGTRALYDLALDTFRPGASLRAVPASTDGPPAEWTAATASLDVLPTRRYLGRHRRR